jgi:hypothetical protein
MKRVAFSLATVLLAAACADQRSPIAPARSLAPRGPSNAIGVGGGPLATGNCIRSTGIPYDYSAPPLPVPSGTAATLTVTDNGVLGLNGTITLNGVEVVSHPMLYGNQPVNLSVPITLSLTTSNVLVCELEGKPGSGLSWTVTVP